MVLVQGDQSHQLIAESKRFLRNMQEQRFGEIWNTMMTYQAKDLVSHTVLPIYFLETGQVDKLLDIDLVKGIALGFQMDHDNQRTNFFQGFSEPFIQHN